MIKVYTFLRRNPQLSQQEFVEYFKTVHAPLCKTLLPGMRSYVGNFAIGVPTYPGMADADFDAVVEQTFDDLEAMRAAIMGEAFSVPERVASSKRFMDTERTKLLIAEVYEVPL
jgi:uncharacterized protein (TIGR02118 family)